MNIFRKLARHFQPVRKPARKAATHGFKPWLETLEDRLAPANVTWSGLGDTNAWSNRFNWQGNAVPLAGDTATIPRGNCEINSNVTVAGLTIGVAGQTADADVGTSLNSVTVTVNGPLRVFAPQGRTSTLVISVRTTFNATGAITVEGQTAATQIDVRGNLTTTRTITVAARSSMLLEANAGGAFANVRATTVTIQPNAKLLVDTLNGRGATITGNLVNQGEVFMELQNSQLFVIGNFNSTGTVRFQVVGAAAGRINVTRGFSISGNTTVRLTLQVFDATYAVSII